MIFVHFGRSTPRVEIVFHPLPYERKRNHKQRRALLREIAGRSGEYNQGGSTRRKILTAYRETALLIALHLDRHGPLAPKALRAMGTGPKTLSIVARNVYGWFERVEKGVYAITETGRQALIEFTDTVSVLKTQMQETGQNDAAEA